MSASEKLKELIETDAPTVETLLTPSVARRDALMKVASVLPQIVAVVKAAEGAERKLWYEYRRGQPVESSEESWAEGEALAGALAALENVLT